MDTDTGDESEMGEVGETGGSKDSEGSFDGDDIRMAASRTRMIWPAPPSATTSPTNILCSLSKAATTIFKSKAANTIFK